MFCVGVARPCLKTLSHATGQLKSERRGKIPGCHGNIVCPGDIALIVTGASFTTTGEMKNSQFSFSTSQPLYMNPALSSLSLIHFPSFICCSHLRKTNLHVYLLFSQRNPNTNSEKLFIVHRQLPPGVLVSQKALQMQREISFLRSPPPPWKNTEEMHANVWMPLITCCEVLHLTLPYGSTLFSISVGNTSRRNTGVPWRYVENSTQVDRWRQ